MKDFPGGWLILIGMLFAVQTWVIPAVVNGVTSSTLMKGTAEEGGSSAVVSNDDTYRAFARCNRHLESLDSQQVSKALDVPLHPEKTWDIGFGRFVVQASVTLGDQSSSASRRAYLCRVHFDGGDADDSDRWIVDGFEFSQPRLD